MSPAKFCEQCGAPLRPTTKFCGNCGVQVQPPAALPQTSPSPPIAAAAVVQATPAVKPNTEAVIGVITGLERPKGFMKTEMFNLVITPTRLVLALMTQKMINDAVQQARAEAKRQGKGWMEQIGAQMTYLDFIASKYQEMSVEQIMAEQPGNFYIPNNQIESVEITSNEADEEALLTEVKRGFVIETPNAKYEFYWKGGPSPQEGRELLCEVLGEVVQ